MWSEETKTGIKYVERYIDPLTGKKKRVSITLTGKKQPPVFIYLPEMGNIAFHR